MPRKQDQMTNVSIDMAKEKFDAAADVDGIRHRGTFSNNGNGRNDFHRWLKKYGITDPHLFMEATGRYGESLATWAHRHGWKVTIINPRRIRKFAEAQGLWNKTDRLDADVILDFAASQYA